MEELGENAPSWILQKNRARFARLEEGKKVKKKKETKSPGPRTQPENR